MSFPIVELPPSETNKRELHVILHTSLVENPIQVRLRTEKACRIYLPAARISGTTHAQPTCLSKSQIPTAASTMPAQIS